MKIDELIKLLENKLAALELSKIAAISSGDLDAVLLIEQTVSDTTLILNKLQ